MFWSIWYCFLCQCLLVRFICSAYCCWLQSSKTGLCCLLRDWPVYDCCFCHFIILLFKSAANVLCLLLPTIRCGRNGNQQNVICYESIQTPKQPEVERFSHIRCKVAVTGSRWLILSSGLQKTLVFLYVTYHSSIEPGLFENLASSFKNSTLSCRERRNGILLSSRDV